MDRNEQLALKMMKNIESLSARRAWIEIAIVSIVIFCITSLSARRAWIEIKSSIEEVSKYVVALRKESVDRNIAGCQLPATEPRRSPQGERG